METKGKSVQVTAPVERIIELQRTRGLCFWEELADDEDQELAALARDAMELREPVGLRVKRLAELIGAKECALYKRDPASSVLHIEAFGGLVTHWLPVEVRDSGKGRFGMASPTADECIEITYHGLESRSHVMADTPPFQTYRDDEDGKEAPACQVLEARAYVNGVTSALFVATVPITARTSEARCHQEELVREFFQIWLHARECVEASPVADAPSVLPRMACSPNDFLHEWLGLVVQQLSLEVGPAAKLLATLSVGELSENSLTIAASYPQSLMESDKRLFCKEACDGLVPLAAERGALVAPNIVKGAEPMNYFRLWDDAKSSLVIPQRLGSEQLLVLSIECSDVNAFNSTSIRMLREALRGFCHSYERVLERLRGVIMQMLELREPQGLLQYIAKSAVFAREVDVFPYSRAAGKFSPGYGTSHHFNPEITPRDDGWSRYVVDHMRPVFVELCGDRGKVWEWKGAWQEIDAKGRKVNERVLDRDQVGDLGVPMMATGPDGASQCCGVIWLKSDTLHKPTPKWLEWITHFAQRAGETLDRSNGTRSTP
ncbi:MAG: hypothetical protein AAGA68_10455 [Pseudomonadota bacterium]